MSRLHCGQRNHVGCPGYVPADPTDAEVEAGAIAAYASYEHVTIEQATEWWPKIDARRAARYRRIARAVLATRGGSNG